MIVEMFWVSEGIDTDHQNEFQRAKTYEKACDIARNRAIARNLETHVHWVKWEITRGGREVIDGQDDLAAYTPDGNSI